MAAMTTRTLPLAALAALALVGCDPGPGTEVAVTDESEGEFIVATPTPGAVPVEVPTTEMTMVPGPYDTASPATPTGGATPAGTPIATATPE